MTFLYKLWAELRTIMAKSVEMLSLSDEKMVVKPVRVVVRSRK